MKIFITGSSGFIGRNIVSHLKDDESVDLILTTRDCEKVSDRYIYFDLDKLDYESNLFLNFGEPDILLHCAWQDVKQIDSPEHINRYVFQHMKFIENMVKNGISKLVILGSCFEYGKQNGAVIEYQHIKPNTQYAVAKDFLRRYVEFLNLKHSFEFQWLRIFYTYDESGTMGSNIISSLKKAIDNKKKVFDMSKGEQELDFLEVKELSSLIIKVMMQNKTNGIINCCSGVPTKVIELVKSVINKWDAKIELNTGHYPYREFESQKIYGDRKKLDQIV
jgi:dTDP-6-deoxy-L-talose 4-dehydrogenase (NAD+)